MKDPNVLVLGNSGIGYIESVFWNVVSCNNFAYHYNFNINDCLVYNDYVDESVKVAPPSSSTLMTDDD